jgi:hypothetical protein
LHVATRARGLGIAALAGVVLATVNPAPAPVAAASPADKVIAIATAQLGDPWVWAATGPGAFDCSGLVIYSFRQAGYGARVGDGRYRSGYAMYTWFRSRGLTSGSGQRGDVVVYGGGSHVGIYLGNGKVISTLTSGVRIHGLYAVTARFTTFLKTGMSSGTATTSSSSSSSGAYLRSITPQYRYTTAAVHMRTGPGVTFRIPATLPAGDKVLATKVQRNSNGRTWYWVWSWTAHRSGWVLSSYLR